MAPISVRVPESWVPAIERAASAMGQRLGAKVNPSTVIRVAIRDLFQKEGISIDD
jgi:Arc/MetJ-type ribon-helix-helix transcriptional regulator